MSRLAFFIVGMASGRVSTLQKVHFGFSKLFLRYWRRDSDSSDVSRTPSNTLSTHTPCRFELYVTPAFFLSFILFNMLASKAPSLFVTMDGVDPIGSVISFVAFAISKAEGFCR